MKEIKDEELLLYRIEYDYKGVKLVDTQVIKKGSDKEKCLFACINHGEEHFFHRVVDTHDGGMCFNNISISSKKITKLQHKDIILLGLEYKENNFIEKGLWAILSTLDIPTYNYGRNTDVSIWQDKNNTDEELFEFIKYLSNEYNIEIDIDEIKMAFKYGEY